MGKAIDIKNHLKYDVTHQEELNPFLEKLHANFLHGEKSIAFGSTQYKNSQEKCIVLASHFFNQNFPSLKILIITFDMNSGVFSSFTASASQRDSYYFFDRNLAFCDWDTLIKKNIDIKMLVDDFDLIFWDVPDLKMIRTRQQELASSFARMDCLYLVSLKNVSDEEKFKREIMHSFKDHGLDIRTVLPWQFGTRIRKPRSYFSRVFYSLFRR